MTQMELSLRLVSSCVTDQYLLDMCKMLVFTLFPLKGKCSSEVCWSSIIKELIAN